MKLILIATALLLFGCDRGVEYTLYRSSMTGITRVHVATFDAKDGEQYNSENCEIAKSLFQAQPGVKVRFWCEKGRFRE